MRVAVLGTTGCGKSTFARRLADGIGAPHIELDAINWQRGWRDLNTHDPEEFRRRVAAALAAEAWVCDGNYRRVQDVVLARATHLVWLDYSRGLIMRRLFWRSFTRALTQQELWPGTSNREEFSRWLDPEHPLRWAWDTFHDRRRRFSALMDDPSTAHLTRHRLRRPAEAEPLLESLGRPPPHLA